MTTSRSTSRPADAVGRPDPTYAVARLLETHVGRHVTVHWPVEVVEGPDGFVEMTEPRTIAAVLAAAHIDHSKEVATDDDDDDD